MSCFILPAALVVTVLAWAYMRFGFITQVAGILFGIKPVVIAVAEENGRNIHERRPAELHRNDSHQTESGNVHTIEERRCPGRPPYASEKRSSDRHEHECGKEDPTVAKTAPHPPPTTYPMNVAVVNTGPGVTCPMATASTSCCSVSQ